MTDEIFMKEALKEAEHSMSVGDIPIGAVVVKDGAVIGRGYNRRAVSGSPFDHAEMAALREASENLKSWRFDNCTLYVTLEPCAMCAGAIVQCRVSRLVYGARDAKAGAAGSLYDIPNDPRMYHRCSVTSGVLRGECAKLLYDFFAKKRR